MALHRLCIIFCDFQAVNGAMAWLKGLVTRAVKWAIRWLKGLHAGCRREILGLIIVKELALLDLEAGTRVSDVKMRPLPMLRADTAMCE